VRGGDRETSWTGDRKGLCSRQAPQPHGQAANATPEAEGAKERSPHALRRGSRVGGDAMDVAGNVGRFRANAKPAQIPRSLFCRSCGSPFIRGGAAATRPRSSPPGSPSPIYYSPVGCPITGRMRAWHCIAFSLNCGKVRDKKKKPVGCVERNSEGEA
jgi:hypothetical protein